MDTSVARQDAPARVTVRRKSSRRKSSRTVKKARTVPSQKQARKPRGVRCSICGAGPFKSKVGLSVHNGKPKNRESHLKIKGKRSETQAKGVNKYGMNIDSLTREWLDRAGKSSKAVRDILLECVVELKLALR